MLGIGKATQSRIGGIGGDLCVVALRVRGFASFLEIYSERRCEMALSVAAVPEIPIPDGKRIFRTFHRKNHRKDGQRCEVIGVKKSTTGDMVTVEFPDGIRTTVPASNLK